MRNNKLNQPASKKDNTDRAPYEPPAIIYEGLITTRAVTRTNPGDSPPDGANPADVFSTDG